MNNYISRTLLSIGVVTLLLFGGASIATASTTISTDISTQGNLTAGTTTLSNLTAGTTTLSNLIVNGAATSTFAGGIIAPCFATSPGSPCIVPSTSIGLAGSSNFTTSIGQITGWGDSLTAGNGGNHPYLYFIGANIGSTTLPLNNEGVGSETSGEIAVREGGINPTVTFINGYIPQYTNIAAPITFPTGYSPFGVFSGTFNGTIDGIDGTVTYDGAGNYTFNRAVAGATTTVATSTYYSDTGSLNNGIVIIWAGRNDILSTSSAVIEANIAAMVSHLGSNSNYIVMSVINAESEASNTPAYAQIVSLNAALAAQYGAHYFDDREWLVTNGLSSLGLTPTSQDLQDIANDIPPTQLRADGLHFNTYGYESIGNELFNIIENQFINGNSTAVSANDLTDTFNSPPVLGFVTPNAIKATYIYSTSSWNGLQPNGYNMMNLNMGGTGGGSFVVNSSGNLTGGANGNEFTIKPGPTTNGFMEVDSTGSSPLYLNFGSGTGGVIFGTGGYTNAGAISNSGNLSMNGVAQFSGTGTSTFAGGISTPIATTSVLCLGGVCNSSWPAGGGTNYFANSGSTTTLSTGSVLQATTLAGSTICLGGVCNSLWPAGGGTNYFSNSGANTTLTTGTNLIAKTINATSSFNVNAGGYYNYNGTNFLYGSTTLNDYYLGDTTGNLTGSGGDNFAIGDNTLYSLTNAHDNIAIGAYVNRLDTTGSANIGIGTDALFANTTASSLIAIGESSLSANTSGSQNIAVGYTSLLNNTIGSSNTAFGNQSLYNNVAGAANIGFGLNAMFGNVNGSDSIGIGYQSLNENATATDDIAIGYNSGFGAGGSYSDTGNTMIGHQTGFNLSNGSNYNTLIGFQSGYNLTTGASNVIIGQYVDAPSNTATGQLNIGDTIFGTGIYSGGSMSASPVSGALVGIGTSSPDAQLQVTNAASNATTTLEIGKKNQTKGSCLIMYDNTGTREYVSIASGAFVISLTACN